MNRILSSSLLLLLFVGARGSQPIPLTLRVLTYNIHHGEGADGRVDLARLAGVVTSVHPDLVALQEVDEGTERASGVDELAELARLACTRRLARPWITQAVRMVSPCSRAGLS